MTAHEIEYCEPADTTNDIRQIVAPILDGAPLPAGALDRIKSLAAYARQKPGARTLRTLDLDIFADWYDVANALERKFKPAGDQTFSITGAREFPDIYPSEKAYQKAQARCHRAEDRARLENQPAPAETEDAQPTSDDWARRVRGEA